MTVTAELHDGRKLEFPDGTDPAVIQRTVKKVLGQGGTAPAATPPAEVPEPPEPSILSKAWDVYTAPVKAAASMGSSMLAKPASDIAGLVGIAQDVVSPGYTDPTKLKGDVQEALTYRPESKIAQNLVEFNPLSMVAGGFQQMGDITGKMVKGKDPGPVRDAFGNWVGAGVTEGLGLAGVAGAKPAGRAIGAGVGKVIDRVGGKPAAAATEALRTSTAGQVTGAADLLEQQAKALEKGRAPSMAPAAKDVAGVQMKVADKLKAQAAALDKQMDGLRGMHISDDQAGAVIQEEATAHTKKLYDDMEKLAIDNNKTPAMLDGEQRAATGDFVNTNPKSKPSIDQAVKILQKAYEDTPELFQGPMGEQIKALSGKEVPLSEGEQRAAAVRASVNGGAPKATKLQPPEMTLAQAEYWRRWSGSAFERQKTGFGSINDARMKDLNRAFDEAVLAYEPRMGKFIDTWREGMGKIEKAEGGRAGAAATDVITGEGADAVRNQKGATAKRNYLDGSREQAQKLVELTGGKSDRLVSTVSGNLVGKIQDMTPKAAKAFIDKNKGLLEVFPEARPLLEQIVKSKERAEQLANMVKTSAERSEKNLAASEKAKTDLQKQAPTTQAGADKLRQLAQDINRAQTPQEVTTLARAALKAQRDSMPPEQYAKLDDGIRQVEQANASLAKTREMMKDVLKWGAIAAGAGAAGGTAVKHAF
jgi:hypothetical protein